MSLKNVRTLFLALFSFAAAPVLAQEQWLQLNPITTTNLLSVHFTDTATGYAVGDSGKIFKTINGGTNWTQQISGLTRSLFSVQFVNANLGFTVGDTGTILRTTNGGNSWVPRTSGTAKTLREIYFVNANVGYVVGYDSTVLKTTDGGTSWSPAPPANGVYLWAIRMVNADTGYIGGNGGRVMKTTNGGASWMLLTTGANDGAYSLFFTSASHGYGVGSNTFLKTTNGGANWTSQTIGSGSFSDIAFTDSLNGYAVGSNKIFKTTNAGVSWVSQTLPGTGDLESSHFPDKFTGYGVGGSGVLFKHIVVPPAAPVLSLPAANATNTATALGLSWNIVAGAVTYRAQVSTDSGFSTVVYDDSTLTTATTYVENLSYGISHYWRISAKNSDRISEWSVIRKFTTLPLPVPAAPALVSPAHGATGVPFFTTLAWNRALYAATYRVQVATDSTFSSTLVNDSTVTDSVRAVGPLVGDAVYYWRVNARNTSGTSAYSSVRRFTIAPSAVIQGPGITLRNLEAAGGILRFNLPRAAHVRVRLFDFEGKCVAEIVNGKKSAGSHSLSLSEAKAAGLYLLDFQVDGSRQVLKFVR